MFFSHSVVTRGSFSPKSREKRTDDVTIPVDKSEEGVTIVGYYFCEEPIPYRTTLAGRRPTLGQFKHLLTKKGCWRLVKLLTRSFFFVKLANGKQYAVLLSRDLFKMHVTWDQDRDLGANFSRPLILRHDSVSRYFFRKASNEFDSGIVHEEVTDDDALLPLLDGKVIGKVERCQWLCSEVCSTTTVKPRSNCVHGSRAAPRRSTAHGDAIWRRRAVWT